LWFLDQFQPGSPAYNLARSFRWPGPLNLAALNKALNEIVYRHETLRTTFQMGANGPAQVIHPPAPIEVAVVDLQGMPATTRLAEGQRLAAEDALLVFDLSRGPLFRATVIRVAQDDHFLLMAMHHIVSDGWSMGLLSQELGELYQAFAAGRRSPLRPLPMQYAEFARWQRQHLSGAVLDTQVRFWKTALDGAPLVAELPADRPRPPVQSHRGAWQSFTINRSISERLRVLSQQREVTLFMTLFAAFAVFLHRLNGQEDLVIGTPIAGRGRAEIEKLIGFFVNTLVLRIDLGGNPTFLDLLKQVSEVTLEAYAHQDLPFEKLVEELQPERNLSHHPLVQVVFAFQNIPTLASQHAEGIGADAEDGEDDAAPTIISGFSKFDFSLLMETTARGLSAAFEYACDLFDHATITRMVGQFRALLASIAEAPDRPISEFSILGAAERQKVLVDWNRTARPYDVSVCVHQAIERRAAQHPDSTAVVCGKIRKSYGEINGEATHLAYYLRKMLGTPARIGVCLRPSPQMPVAVLAVLKAGAAYLPLDPAYPADRLRAILHDAGVAAVLSDEASAGNLPDARIPVLRLDQLVTALALEDASDLPPRVGPDDAVYVISTSGSTGRPKAVELHHRGFANLMAWFIDEFAITAADKVLLVSPIGFDLTQKNLFAPLMTGGTLHLPESSHFEPRDILDTIEREGITLLNCTPSAAYALVDNTQQVSSLASLRHLFLGGEPIQVRRLWKWLGSNRFKAQVVNTYGPTECTDICAFYRLAEPKALLDQAVPIGRPVANAQLYVLDRYLQPLPVGVAGDLWVGGVGVGIGYVGDSALTDARYRPDPFSPDAPGARLYRTGDLARWRADGALDFLGRRDAQIKLRGFRIELGEIEATLRRDPGVEDVVVIDREGPGSERRLVSYVVPDNDQAGPVRRWLELERSGRLTGCRSFELPNRAAIVHLNRSETDFLYREIFELGAYLKNGIEIWDGACIFDVGANIGLFALFIALHCSGARIFAFEPLPPVFELLRLNTGLYGIDAKAFECGLGRCAGEATFTYYPNVSILSGQFADADDERETVRRFLHTQKERGLIDKNLSDEDITDLLDQRLVAEPFRCPVRTISDIIRDEQIERIDLLKIDVEKAEIEVLEGIAAEDWPRIHQIVLELHDLGDRLRRVRDLLAANDFEVTIDQDDLLGDTGIYNVYAVSRAWRVTRPERTRTSPRWTWASRDRLVAHLRESLGAALPEYMVPQHTVLLPSLPLSANGKVNRRALPLPEDTDRAADLYVAPNTPTQERLTGIWSEVLGAKQISVTANFFDLGGHSLLATQVISRVRNAFRLDLPVRRVFEAPTIAQLAAVIDESISGQSPFPIEGFRREITAYT
jgi:amino acid adenylation domain-containing protein/FkbM family methyltransferase